MDLIIVLGMLSGGINLCHHTLRCGVRPKNIKWLIMLSILVTVGKNVHFYFVKIIFE